MKIRFLCTLKFMFIFEFFVMKNEKNLSIFFSYSPNGSLQPLHWTSSLKMNNFLDFSNKLHEKSHRPFTAVILESTKWSFYLWKTLISVLMKAYSNYHLFSTKDDLSPYKQRVFLTFSNIKKTESEVIERKWFNRFHGYQGDNRIINIVEYKYNCW